MKATKGCVKGSSFHYVKDPKKYSIGWVTVWTKCPRCWDEGVYVGLYKSSRAFYVCDTMKNHGLYPAIEVETREKASESQDRAVPKRYQ